jgi:hypothetical protein
MSNVVRLNEISQKQWGHSIITRVESVEGKPHEPVVTVSIKLPSGIIFKASGKNQKAAKEQAAKEALEAIGLPVVKAQALSYESCPYNYTFGDDNDCYSGCAECHKWIECNEKLNR